MTFSFDDATRVERIGEGRYVGDVHDGWDIRGNANGGYVMALMNSAMRDASGRNDPISLTLHYLAPLPPSRFEIATEVIKQGRRFTTVSASMSSMDKPQSVRSAPSAMRRMPPLDCTTSTSRRQTCHPSSRVRRVIRTARTFRLR